MTEVSYNECVYRTIQKAVKAMEERFFTCRGKQPLPDIVVSLNNRCGKRVAAYVNPEYMYDRVKQDKVHYLAINTDYLDRDAGETLATIYHELCHVYECTYIHIPRNGYHSKAWEALMTEAGLRPVYQNKAKTSVGTEIMEGGEFEAFVKGFLEEHGGFLLPVRYKEDMEVRKPEGNQDRPVADNADRERKTYNRNKTKYKCPLCGANVWGKPQLVLFCGNGHDVEEMEEE